MFRPTGNVVFLEYKGQSKEHKEKVGEEDLWDCVIQGHLVLLKYESTFILGDRINVWKFIRRGQSEINN